MSEFDVKRAQMDLADATVAKAEAVHDAAAARARHELEKSTAETAETTSSKRR